MRVKSESSFNKTVLLTRAWWNSLKLFNTSSLLRWYCISIVVIIIDQLTKAWAEASLVGYKTIVVLPFFKFELAYNSGAAFSFLQDAGGWQRWFFSIIALVVSAGITYWIAKTVALKDSSKKWELLALSLVLGGAIGNVYDRIFLGHVVDFIVWHYEHHQFPTFNIADSAISLGAAILIFDMLFLQKEKNSNNADQQSTK